MPPVLHGQAEADRHRGPRGPLPSPSGEDGRDPEEVHEEAVAAVSAPTPSEVEELFEAIRAQAGVPGASLAVLREGAVETYASGIVDADTERPVSASTLFRLGSITKVYTSTLVMQLAGERTLHLDAPVRRYVPELRLARPELDEQVTIRSLLTHSSGLDLGDVFGPFGEDDDCIARYVDGVGDVDFIHEPGEMFSYTNGGMIILGRVIEVLTGMTWDEALRFRLLGPLGLNDTVAVLQEDVVRRRDPERLARGHDLEAMPVELEPMADIWGRSTAPAGSTLCATAADLVRFAGFHMAEGDDVLANELRSQMRELAFVNPTYSSYGQGLGWGVHERSGTRCVAHGGGHYGQASYVVAVPERNFAVGVLTNSARGATIHMKIAGRLLKEYLALTTSADYRPDEPGAPESLEPFVGSYSRRSSLGQDSPIQFGLELDERGLHFGGETVLERATAATFTSPGAVFRFLRFDGDGRPTYAHVGNRAFRHTP